MTRNASEVPMDLLSIAQAYVQLPAEKRAAFRDRLRARGIDGRRLPMVPYPASARRFRLSYAQERLWFLWRLEPLSAAYNVLGAVRLRGELDEARLRRAFDRVVARHESLRMRFEEAQGVPYQTPDGSGYGWRSETLDARAADTGLQSWLAARSAQPFDLERGPVLRAALLRLDEQDHVLHVAMHHIVSDGLSVDVLMRDFARAYADLPLEEGAVLQYGDYAQWQREWFDEAALEAQLACMRSRLDGEQPTLDWPAARGAARRDAGERIARCLPPEVTEAVARLAREADATPFMVLLAVYDVLLSRYGAQHDIRVGVPQAGRERAELAPVIGFFVNTLVVRAEVRGADSFATLLAQVRERVLEAQACAELPFSLLVDALQPQRSLARSPLFQAMFNHLGRQGEALSLPGLHLTPQPMPVRTARFDMVLEAREAEEGLELALVFAQDRIDAALAARMLEHYVALLKAALAAPHCAVASLALAPRRALPIPRKPFQSVAQRFLTAARRDPAALAVHCEGERLDYASLAAWSARIAQGLQAAGTAPETRVGLCLTRSAGLVAALLGALRSPGAFVPLDPAYPAERLGMMIEDARVGAVLADAASIAQCGALFAGMPVLDIAALRPVDPPGPIEAVGLPPHPEQLAYVIYTSGSTGRPKGVAVSHAALAAHLDDFIVAHAIDARDTQLQSSTINFDVALHEMLPALLCGGRVEMRGSEAWDIESTSRHLSEAGVTFSRLPTAYWQQWLREPPPPAALAALRQITVGGEALPGDALARWRAGPLGHIGLANLYGPTETTVACMWHDTRASDVEQAIVPIGTPYASRSAIVLDAHGNEAPLGVPGELCIGGHTLARAYLDRPGLSAERFVPDPAVPGARLYRTGDLCRQREDGTIDFLGRLDQQIKLRGFRIEPGEIEAALRHQRGVAQAVVALARDGGTPRLLAYVVPQEGARLDESVLLHALGQTLPAHMVPSALAVLEALPTLPNGKVERAALPAIAASAAGERRAPSDARERQLLDWWSQILGREDLGVDDDFFAAGGDSILSLQLIARAREAGWRLTPRQVFEQPSVARLARAMTPLTEESAKLHAECHDALPLTPIQAAFFTLHPDGEAHWNQSLLLGLREAPQVPALQAALQALRLRHDALRLRMERHAQGWRQRVIADAEVRHAVLTRVDLSEAGEDWRQRLQQACAAAQRSLDPEAGRMMQAVWLRLPQQAPGSAHRLLLVIHHLAVDGVSWRILLSDLQAAYADACASRTPVLPPATPWSAWVASSQEGASAEATAQALGIWQDLLDGASSALPAARATLAQSRVLHWRLAPHATQALREAAPRAYRLRLDEVLLAALTRVLASDTGTSGLLVSLEGHGRDGTGPTPALDLSRSVGWFTLRHPAWLLAHEDDEALLLATRERLRAQVAAGACWGRLQTDAASGRRAAVSALPRAALSFNYLGQFDGTLADDSPFVVAGESPGAELPADEPLGYALEISGEIVDASLRLDWRYDPLVMPQARVEALLSSFEQALAGLVAHCLHAPPRALAADFPLAALAQPAFAALFGRGENVEDLYPATALQQGLLFHTQMEAGAYQNAKRLHLRGSLDVDALRAAWREVIGRHPILRTRFVRTPEGRLLQCVQKKVADPLTLHDWRARHDYEAALAQWLAQEAPHRLDLDAAPLLCVELFQRPDGSHDMVWLNHHAISDGWSQARLLGELRQIYRGLRTGAPVTLAPAVPYRAYVAWLAQQPDGAHAWRTMLTQVDRPALLADTLPSTRADGAARFHHAVQHLDASLGAALAAAGARHGVTLNTLTQAAWGLVLARFANRRQAAFGITVAGRPAELPGAGDMQGLFINTLPLWVDVPAEAELGAWLRALQARNLALRQVEHTPLASIQQWAGPHFGPLFDSLLVFENYPLDAAADDASDGLDIAAAQAFERTHYALTLGIVPGERIALEWSWDAARVPDALRTAFAQAYASLLGALSDAACRSVAQLRVPGPAARCGASLQAGLPRPFDSALARFLRHAVATPNALAVHCEGQSLSYAQLAQGAARVAARLRDAGVRRGDRVGLCVERGPDLLAALLGTWQAGAAFVPLDPVFPPARLREMIEDAAPAALLSGPAARRMQAALLSDAPCPVLNAETHEDASTAVAVPAQRLRPQALAYVIYTSGSTGRPKGVAIPHGALSEHLDDFIADSALEAQDRVLQFTTVNFDTAMEQIFATLAVGAALEMRGPTLWTVDQTRRVLATRGVTLADFPTGYWRQWAQQLPDDAQPGALRRVTMAGEALPGAAIAQWFDGPLASVPLVNNYGPTETTITASAQRVTPVHAACPAAPIGMPRGSRLFRLLDLDGMPAPAGGVGELCIGGPALAHGYLGRPAQTAERFVPDALGAPGSRLYRSGDACRWLPDGSLAFIGRLDEQIKVRGVRIEPGEIENALCAVPEVAEAVVVARGEDDARRLLGYVVARPGAAPLDGEALRDTLAARLPAHLVPAAIVVLAALPSLPNGKLDRRALPEPASAQTAHVEPAPGMQALLADIWQQVLGGPRVGAHDDFFALGGHSLLALQVCARLARALGREVPLRLLFDEPMLAGLVAALSRDAHGCAAARGLAALKRLGCREARATHAQERLWFLWRLAPDNPAYHLSTALRLDGALERATLRAALHDVIARHDALRTRFEARDGAPWQVVDAEGLPEWCETELDGNAALDGWLAALNRRSFDLAHGPVLRVGLARLPDGAHALALALHHIAGDGASLQILLGEWFEAYQARLQGRVPRFTPLPVQYLDYAVWQRRELDETALARQLDYWRERLGGEQPVLELPSERPRQAPRGDAAGERVCTVDAALAEAVQAWARRHDASVFMTLLAAFHALLHRYGGQQDIRVGIPISGRNALALENLIGFFVNTAVIRTAPHGALRFDALLDDVRERVLEAQANQDLPFARIVEALQPVRAPEHTPLFQAMFNLEVTGPAGARALSEGLRWQALEIRRQAVQFDLSLSVRLGTELSLCFGYASDLFDDPTVARIQRDYLAILRRLVEPDAAPPRLRDFVLEAPALAQRGAAAPHTFVPLAARIREQAHRQPEAIAVRSGAEQLSYGELEAWSDQLALALRARRLPPEARVGLCVARSAAMLAALLAVQKAGLCYVPLDPAYPPAHLRGMIDDAALDCALVDDMGRACLAEIASSQVLLDVGTVGSLPDPRCAPDWPAPHPAQLAYVIYTSGSSGTPKGVGVSHAALGRFLNSMQARLRLAAGEVWLAVTTLSFDIAALELYLPLMTGGTVVLASREEAMDGRRLNALLAEAGASTLQATPMGWRLLCDGGFSGSPRRLRALCGGEALPADLAERLHDCGVELWNLYGPTETTIWSSAARLVHGGAPIVLGEPLEATHLLLRDSHGNPVPQFGIGELCIGGDNLARGYLGRPGLSAERFVPDEHGAPGARLYRTGDLCRLQAQGALQFLGRADQQVKLRGVRIELGAIEAAMRAVDGVSDAACQVQGQGDAQRLVGFYVGRIAASVLRDALVERLPAAQLPAQLTPLSTMPRTANGKLDRRALPTLPVPRREAVRAPRTPTEALLCDIWAEVLGRECVSADDDFFALGGHSLLALRVASRAGAALEREIALPLLFEHPVLADLAAALDATAPAAGGQTQGLDALQDLLDSL